MDKKNEGLIQAIKFTLFSISAGIIDALSFTLLTEVICPQAPLWLRTLISLALSVIWNFTLNRKYTFQSATNVPVAMLKVLGYYLVFTPLSLYLGNLATEAFHITQGSVGEYIVKGVTMLANFVTEFLFDKYVVFTDVRKKDISTEG